MPSWSQKRCSRKLESKEFRAKSSVRSAHGKAERSSRDQRRESLFEARRCSYRPNALIVRHPEVGLEEVPPDRYWETPPWPDGRLYGSNQGGHRGDICGYLCMKHPSDAAFTLAAQQYHSQNCFVFRCSWNSSIWVDTLALFVECQSDQRQIRKQRCSGSDLQFSVH